MTAVEWLIEELQLYYEGKSKLVYYEIIDQAKEMEKQQIYGAFYDGEENAHKYKSSPTLYYNETYGSKASDEHHEDKLEEITYTEEQLKLAYMQGYNRGVDGNPNQMESYIEQLKQL